jgi:hypothetical protein
MFASLASRAGNPAEMPWIACYCDFHHIDGCAMSFAGQDIVVPLLRVLEGAGDADPDPDAVVKVRGAGPGPVDLTVFPARSGLTAWREVP